MPFTHRHIVAIGCFLGVAVALLVFDFRDRGRHFAPQAGAKADRLGVYDLGQAQLLTKVLGNIRSNYVDPSRVDPQEMCVQAMRAIQSSVPEVMVQVTRDTKGRASQIDVQVGDARLQMALAPITDLYRLGWKLMETFGFLEDQLPHFRDLEAIEYAAINGLLSTLDPHSVMLTPKTYREMQLGTQGRFGGLGIVISVRQGMLQIMSVMGGTPAERAELQSGDRVAQIGEESTINMSLNEAVNRLRGEPGSEVTIWIMREGFSSPRPFTLTREEIQIPSVHMESFSGGIGYVEIRNFQANTDGELGQALETLRERPEGLKGLILDLRENPGGLLEQAVAISDRFIADGIIVTVVGEGIRKREERHAREGETLSDLPIVVLVNRGSASASEIVAGALKHSDRAVLMGSTTFGKGSVQVLYTIDDAALKLTVSQYLTPGDVSIQSVGIVPDIAIVDLTVDEEMVDLQPSELDATVESDLQSHLSSANTTSARPSVQLRMLEQVSKQRKSRYDRFESDGLITLARELLTTSPFKTRQRMLIHAAGTLKSRQAEEDRRIIARLAELDVDWTQGAAPPPKTLEVTLDVVGAGKGGDARVQAGGKMEVVAHVTNRGARAAHRVHGVIDSAIAPTAGREMIFGRIPPGERRSWRLDVDLPESLVTQADALEMTLYSDGQPIHVKARAVVEIQEVKRPRFAWTVQLRDPEGNGDGLVQRGEAITVDAWITNLGEGNARELLATLKNQSGEDVFIESGRQKLGPLDPGKTTRASFDIKINEALDAQDIQLSLMVLDQQLRVWWNDDLSLPIYPTELPPARPYEEAVSIGPDGAMAHGGAHLDSPIVARVDPGARLNASRRCGPWIEVSIGGTTEAPSERAAWIRADRILATPGGVEPGDAGVTITPDGIPPEVHMGALESTPLVTDARTFELPVSARFGPPSEDLDQGYVYIFRNDDKIHFQSMSQENDDAPGTLEFALDVPLEPGRNTIYVVARQGERHVTSRKIIVLSTQR